MMPSVKKLIYKHKKENELQEFMIKEKDYGEMVLYDIFYKNTFLFTVSQEGQVLLSNWQFARSESVCLDEDIIGRISSFILSQRSLSS